MVLSWAALSGAAHAQAPWQQGEQIRNGLFDAQTDIILEGGASAGDDVAAAQRAISGKLERQLADASPANLAALRAAVSDAQAAVAAEDEVGLAAARGRALAALRHGAFDVAVDATSKGEVERARGWLLIRDFRQVTRFTRPGVDATDALNALEAGEMPAGEAVIGVRKDLLDAYQARLTTFVEEATEADEKGFAGAFAENAAIAAGYWPIIAGEFQEVRSKAERIRADRDFAAMARAAERGDTQAFLAARDDALEDIDGFTAAPFTPDEQARRAQQLTRFLDLIPVEYDRGTEDGEVTLAFEIQEAVAFSEGARAAFSDIESTLIERDPAGVDTVNTALAELDRISNEANEGGEVASQDEIESVHDDASSALEEMSPEEWTEGGTEADFDLVDISLDQMEAAVGAGEREQAEQARLSAYAFFEFGPERLLRALDPQLVAEVEGLVWYGADGEQGLAELIASDDTTSRDVRDTRLALDERLEDAREVTGEGASGITVVTNAALIVFREGLEAILIIAAITASMVGANRRLRKPVYRGALLGLPASAILFAVAVLLLDSLAQYGEKLEAIVGLVAVAILLLVLNWFFHKVYWTEWISSHRKRSKALTGAAAGGVAAGATVLGLYMLGFTSVFREGFETVLFLQALQLESGTGIVMAGVGLGLIGVAAVGAVTFKLEQKLPYKRMLIVTGVLISLVLVVMVGNTMRTLQGVGWLSITPVEVDFPLWMGTWLGVFPTVETLGAQLAAFAFVIGSYFAAEWLRKRNVRKMIAEAEEQFEGDRSQPRSQRRPSPRTATETAGRATTAHPPSRSTAAGLRSASKSNETRRAPSARRAAKRFGRANALVDDRELGPGALVGGDVAADLGREHEADVLLDGLQLADVGRSALAEELDQLGDELLGGAGTGGDPDGLGALEPFLLDLVGEVDQVRSGTVLASHLDEANRVRRVRRADHEDQVALAGELLDGLLAVGRRVTDVVGLRTGHVREPLLERVDDRAGLVDRKGRLGDVGDPVRVIDLEGLDVGLGLDEHDVVGRLAGGSLDLLVAVVADEDDRVAVSGELARLDVDLGDEGAGRVDRPELARLGVLVHRGRDPVRGEDDHRALGDLGLLVDEDRSALGQLLDHVLVVDDLLADVDRRTVDLERMLDGLDGAVDAGAVAARRCQQDLLRPRDLCG